MSILWLMAFVFIIVGIEGHMEDKDAANRRHINWLAKRDLKAQCRRGDILSQRRRGNYR